MGDRLELSSLLDRTREQTKASDDVKMLIATLEHAHADDEIGYEMANGCRQLPLLWDSAASIARASPINVETCRIESYQTAD